MVNGCTISKGYCTRISRYVAIIAVDSVCSYHADEAAFIYVRGK